MKITNIKDKDFNLTLKTILNRGEETSEEVLVTVRDIIAEVRKRGDRAVVEYTKKFDKVDTTKTLLVSEKEINDAFKKIPKKEIKLLELARDRVAHFSEKQIEKSWVYNEDDDAVLGQKVTALEKVGIYVPGGKAAYPSTAIMNAVPARVAGVKNIFMTTPPTNLRGKGVINPHVLAAAKVAGVSRVFRTGGAQAIAALAYGTRTIPKVDKIVGPGNIFVATAKKLVFGAVDIDMIAGPSEVLIINDGTGDPTWMAMDLLAQAEHDELASSVLITTSLKMAKAVKKAVALKLKTLKRRKTAEASINAYGVIFVVKDIKEALKLSNRIAPEHLEVFTKDPGEILKGVTNAGAIFLGYVTPEAIGDYLAGPNHTLPTGGTARFSSPLGAYDFLKRSSVIGITPKGLKNLGPSVEKFARLEGLTAHAESVKIRLKDKTKKS
ncbi:MAG: histidinol dehydrogenase [Deltaproteobacteria bacterium]|nr:histidinol dehydrogenase [Deltaproteobacteria bacterium]